MASVLWVRVLMIYAYSGFNKLHLQRGCSFGFSSDYSNALKYCLWFFNKILGVTILYGIMSGWTKGVCCCWLSWGGWMLIFNMFEIIYFHKNSTYLNDHVIMLLEYIFNFNLKQRDAYLLFLLHILYVSWLLCLNLNYISYYVHILRGRNIEIYLLSSHTYLYITICYQLKISLSKSKMGRLLTL